MIAHLHLPEMHLIQDNMMQHYTGWTMKMQFYVWQWISYRQGHTVDNLLRVALQDHPVGRNQRTHASLGVSSYRRDGIRLSNTANSCEAHYIN